MSDFSVEIEREEDGRWISEIPDLPGVMTYGASRQEAVARAKALAFRVLADRLEHGEDIPELRHVFAVGFPRTPGPRSASRTRRGSRFTLSPLAARAHASAPAQATGQRHVSAAVRRAEFRLVLPEERSGTASGTPSAPRLGGGTAAAPPPRPFETVWANPQPSAQPSPKIKVPIVSQAAKVVFPPDGGPTKTAS
jgi:predicted RNase H-like HicB family nuclease